MSNTDSFIDEVTEEVRRDRLYASFRKYGWIAILVVVLIVGGAAWREYQKAQARSSAQAFGDAISAALESDDAEARIAALSAIQAPQPGAQAILAMLLAAEQGDAQDDAAATQTLDTIANASDVPLIYRQIASFKALSRKGSALSIDVRRSGFEALATAGAPLRLLAEEQIALLDIEAGDTESALSRLKAILADSEATAGLRRRASQLIVSLGGTLDAA
ncbi:tetratricopeptide repeat protein [Puniceibacterium confluentis]|uniref:tetratricopeptide repeat protein n=1 Tax=Puniceibacterium confluentis TaxID=1958944 RepID=UPI0011B7BD84|nr:tetratricopeptide repeat protein [Puniceibacterium confluentis]